MTGEKQQQQLVRKLQSFPSSGRCASFSCPSPPILKETVLAGFLSCWMCDSPCRWDRVCAYTRYDMSKGHPHGPTRFFFFSLFFIPYFLSLSYIIKGPKKRRIPRWGEATYHAVIPRGSGPWSGLLCCLLICIVFALGFVPSGRPRPSFIEC
ncbi:hypothetical protein BD289DRAFT_204638 [Coniella lustricola]|uniref:Uncharacterized protein n=1 Tax=Coniella lustricola TaxID=2025994 RepID=A0A2T2ZSG3_9PEZI|nr:hypothetical protein BD289DRAFT_204638 [Coniella lustricola]